MAIPFTTQFNTVISPPFQHLLARRTNTRSNSHDTPRSHALALVAQHRTSTRTGVGTRAVRPESRSTKSRLSIECDGQFLSGISLFRPLRAIAEPWDEGDGIEWAKMAVDRVTWQWLCGMPTRRYAGGGSQATDGHLSRGAARGPPHTRWPTATRPGLTKVGRRNEDR